MRDSDLRGAKRGGWTSLELMMAILGLLGLGIAVVWPVFPNLVEARKGSSPAPTEGALKTIGTSQSLFREGDKDGDRLLDYGTLAELADQDLIDDVLGTGLKQGYLFESFPSASAPEFCWMATANPIWPGTTGDRYFATNHEGVTYYTTSGPVWCNPECRIPNGMQPVGK